MLRPWHQIPISASKDPLVEIPFRLLRLEPHPYLSLGAPYANGSSPWRLRSKVIDRLFLAQDLLKNTNSELQLAIFDAWRPLAVQKFMVEYSIQRECLNQAISFSDSNYSSKYQEIVDQVQKFWAPPSTNPLTPPPHSTGAAIDITLATSNGLPIDMGGAIDEIGDISMPNHYSQSAKTNPNSISATWHSRRLLLHEMMSSAGFVQHPNEWWHFSYGDQLWAWKNNSANAFYGSLSFSDSNSIIF
ncbi:M15 family metallopeptidase [Prochlorococcus marinus]|uniref:D-alanyl-D-alanine dipeptidase n=1 Tax=Prochlorococcus marinus (strain MIT 9211) TaxID=93059 RepID=A9BAS5_PROM4|nr:M15 family metallopeptidase [Prochlorococcus marinus]ABX08937.1 D-ala-D-ala dipeptidase [Prochlorococcus marinus str. MIT 9211]